MIARQETEARMREVLEDARNGMSVHERRDRARKGPPRTQNSGNSSTSSPKPREVIHTKHDATVIVQCLTGAFTRDQIVAALKDALKQAKARRRV
ncbi:hypothetical protein HY256_09055 [Candidatus Sumerlaeota bacterium]|nr:hypothetical protein [Candidatus Sumerlaeota bacterium]